LITLALVAVAIVAGCAGRAKKTEGEKLAQGVALGIALAPQQDVLVWTTDEEGRETSVWLRGNAHEAAVVASGPGVLIPIGTELWQWRETESAVALCDCDAWEPDQEGGPCPETLEPGWARSVELVELVSGETVELSRAPEGTDEDNGPTFTDYAAVAEPIASVGPYLFFRLEERSMTCGAAHGDWSSEFKVFDLVGRELVDPISPEERARILTAEQQTAYQLMADDRLVDIGGAEDLQLTMIEPRWTPGGLGVIYQFTADASYADSDDNWGAYTRSVRVPARDLPLALVPFALLPDVLSGAITPVGSDVRVGGFAPIAGADEQVAAIFRALGAERTTEPPAE